MKIFTHLFQKMGYTPKDLNRQDLVLPDLSFAHELDEEEIEDCRILFSEMIGIRNIFFSGSISVENINEIIGMISQNKKLKNSDLKIEIEIDSNANIVIDGRIYKSLNKSDYDLQIKHFDRYLGFDICTPIDKFHNVETLINDFVNSIKVLNSSPLEQIMLVYDAVKMLNYKEDEKNPKNVRRISNILCSNNAVCVGYTALFNEILSRLGFKVAKFEFKPRHVCSIVEVNDPKYGIDGIYNFDSTLDSLDKNKGSDIERTYAYAFFAKTKGEFDNLKSRQVPQQLAISLSETNEKKAINNIFNINPYELESFISGFYSNNDDLSYEKIKHSKNIVSERNELKRRQAEKIMEIRRKYLGTQRIPIETIFKVVEVIRNIQYGDVLSDEQIQSMLEKIKEYNGILLNYYYNEGTYDISYMSKQ